MPLADQETDQKQKKSQGLPLCTRVLLVLLLVLVGRSRLEVAKKLSGLGPLLRQLNVQSAEDSLRTQHLVLRLILNITNNNPDLCDAFSERALLAAIFDIVERDFLQASVLPTAVLKDTQVEGVILALGTLSNLAEHSSCFRQMMLDCSVDGRNMVDRIAFTFRDQVEIASEVSPFAAPTIRRILTRSRLHLLSRQRHWLLLATWRSCYATCA